MSKTTFDLNAVNARRIRDGKPTLSLKDAQTVARSNTSGSDMTDFLIAYMIGVPVSLTAASILGAVASPNNNPVFESSPAPVKPVVPQQEPEREPERTPDTSPSYETSTSSDTSSDTNSGGSTD